MSSLHDPFDLITTGKDMENIVPFLAPTKVNQMVDMALALPQIPCKKPAKQQDRALFWKVSGVGMAACLALFITLFSSDPVPVMESSHIESAHHLANEDVNEFNELVILDTLDKY